MSDSLLAARLLAISFDLVQTMNASERADRELWRRNGVAHDGVRPRHEAVVHSLRLPLFRVLDPSHSTIITDTSNLSRRLSVLQPPRCLAYPLSMRTVDGANPWANARTAVTTPDSMEVMKTVLAGVSVTETETVTKEEEEEAVRAISTATATGRPGHRGAVLSDESAYPYRYARIESSIHRRLNRQCIVTGCSNYNIAHGRCFRHGGGKTCLVVDCKRSAKARGLCWRYGGSVICTIEGCTRGAKSRGLCWSHGGGTKCSEPTCDKTMISKGLCWTHGGGKRCLFDGCKRPASEKRQNFCPKHHAQVSQRGYVFEV